MLTFVLDRGMEGFVQSKPFRKMGIHSSRTGELFFNNVRLGRDRLLGETERQRRASDGRASARSNFSAERIGVAAMALGVIEECLRLCVDYAKSRTLWGQEIGQFQLIQLKLANMEVARMNVRNMLFRVIEAAQTGTPISLAEASAIKWYCSQAATDVAMEAVQLFGGNGYMTEYRVEQLARDAKSLMIYAGSNEVQITHVARGLLERRLGRRKIGRFCRKSSPWLRLHALHPVGRRVRSGTGRSPRRTPRSGSRRCRASVCARGEPPCPRIRLAIHGTPARTATPSDRPWAASSRLTSPSTVVASTCMPASLSAPRRRRRGVR